MDLESQIMAVAADRAGDVATRPTGSAALVANYHRTIKMRKIVPVWVDILSFWKKVASVLFPQQVF
jgi:hypothetical protein